MKPEAVHELLVEAGAVLQGHFLLTSGRHSAFFVQCSQIMQHPRKVALLAAELASRLPAGGQPGAVAGPAMGGVILAYEVARALGGRALFAEKGPDGMAFRRGFRLEPGEPVLVVEDVVTTGGSVGGVIAAVRAAGARAVAVGALVDRSGGRVDFGVPFVSLLALTAADYPPGTCPLCRDGLPLTLPKR